MPEKVKSTSMVLYHVKLRQDQREYLDRFRESGGNPAQFLRIALDKLIAVKPLA